ncbi:hypothetical protein J4218_02265 [Candidatus Pacearchaeota archaeon]|nr:hypothetical protein [Candidatus Pacearchaeota archaeon]
MKKITLRYVKYDYPNGRLPTEMPGHTVIEGIELNEHTPNISGYNQLMRAFTGLMDEEIRMGRANSGRLELTIE